MVVSADSFQIYRDFGVASDKVTVSEMDGISHFGIDIVDATAEFNVADFLAYAVPVIESELQSGRSPIVVGGTHMYVEKLLFTSRLDDKDPVADTPVPIAHRVYSHAHLREVDPDSALKLHPNDKRRVSRAIDYFYDTGVRLSATLTAQKRVVRWENTVVLVKRGRDEDLEGRVSRRIQSKMVENGALRAELLRVTNLVADEKLRWNKGLLQAIGYREFEPFVTSLILTGKEDESLFSNGIEDVCRNTVRYAKKQSKWIKKISAMIDVHLVDDFSDSVVETIRSAPPLRLTA